MAGIIKTYKQNVGAMRFIGKKYGDGDRVNGTFGAKWCEWFENGWFSVIESQISVGMRDIYEDGDASIGLMRGGHGKLFEYWIGYFMPENTTVPEGFEHIDFPKGDLGVCWVYGKEEEVFCLEEQCVEGLEKNGFVINYDLCFERYACPRFTTPDEKGNIILDICFYLVENDCNKAYSEVERIINDAALSGDILENAMDFASFLKANDMIAGGNHGEVTYKGKCVCYMRLDSSAQKPGPWTIWTDGDYSSGHPNVPLDESIKEIAWANVNFCASCGGSCSPGKRKTILGKEFDNVCSSDMAFYLPNSETLECVKKLLEIRKNTILEVSR